MVTTQVLGQSTLGYRHEFALVHSGLMVTDAAWRVAKALKRPRRVGVGLTLATPAQFERRWDGSLADLAALAEVYGVDPRWLALGIIAPAAAAAIWVLEREWRRTRTKRMGVEDREEIAALLSTTPEPDKGAGVCRYCLCTDDCGCGNCYWIDDAATICSSCLEPAEV